MSDLIEGHCGMQKATMAGERIRSVEYLRGIAAVMVMWFHLTAGQKSLLAPAGTYGYLGFFVFFVISGFIIPVALSQRGYTLSQDGWRFFARRLVRLEPPYLFTVLLCLALIYAGSLVPGFQGQVSPSILTDAALHPAYLVPWFGGQWLNPVFWTLAIEFQYYLVILFLAPMLLSVRPWVQRTALLGWLAISFVTSDPRVIFFYAPLFGLGFVAFLKTRTLSGAETVAWATSLALAAIYNLGWIAGLSGALAMGAILIEWPSLPPLAFLGTISYSLYLLHVPIGGRVINLATRLPNTTITVSLATATAVLASIGGAYLLCRFIERPAMAWAHRI